MHDLAAVRTAPAWRPGLPRQPLHIESKHLAVPDDLLPRLNLSFSRIWNVEWMFDNDRNISVSSFGSARLTLDHNLIHRNRLAEHDRPELPFRFTMSPKVALVAMLVAVVNLIPVLAPPFEREPR